MKSKNIIILIAGVLLLSSCNASRFGWQLEDRPVADDGTVRMVEDFDPLLLDDDDIVIKKNQLNVRHIEDDQFVSKDSLAQVNSDSGPKLVLGFRVNLMSGKDEIAINKEKKKAMIKFQYNVYIVFESPYYKIRLGDFLTHEEAALVREQARRRGFDGAFIAQCLVDREKAEMNRQL